MAVLSVANLARVGITGGWPLAEWLAALRFISAKGHPPVMVRIFETGAMAR